MGAPSLGAPGPRLGGSSDRERLTPETSSVKSRRNVPAGEPSKSIMNVVEQHISVDGLLKFVACRDDNGDMTLGFAVVCREGDNDITLLFYGHTHADILASLSGLPEAVAVRCYIDDILEDRAVIAVSRIGDGIRDMWVSDDPVSELRYKPKEETIEFRYWSGKRL
jgi:hypothetical protein